MQPVQFIDVARSFGAHRVFERLSLTLPPGEITLLVGANGSGKSTLLRLAAGLLLPDRGKVQRDPHIAVGYCGHRTGLYPQFTVSENLSFVAELRECQGELPEAIVAWDLSAILSRPLGALSKGWQARVALCAATLAAPGCLLLDEPSSALDDRGVDLLRVYLRRRVERAGGPGIVAIATHDIGRLLDVATRVLVIDGGEVLADSSSSEEISISISTVIDRYREVNR